ncbi:MAG: hypothetical protein ACOX4V_02525 [Anaerovoracaceae bacterium]|jgi:hypothetical protein
MSSSAIDNSKKKLVFFFAKDHTISGSLIFLLSLARCIAQKGEYEVYYVNYSNRKLEKEYEDNLVNYCDINNCDFTNLDGADFVIPLNYIFIFLEKANQIKTGKILLYDWHPELMSHLSNQFLYLHRDNESLLELFKKSNALAFMDKSCLLSVNRWTNTPFEENYVPVFSSSAIKKYTPRKPLNNGRINIGWMSRLDADKINSLINLLDMLMLSDISLPIDVHIIGDGASRNQLKLQKYAPKIRFIFTSYLFGEERDNYLIENLDFAVVMGISALDISNLGIPTVIPIISSKPFFGNQFVFLFNTKDYSLGWTSEELQLLKYETYTIEQVIAKVYAPRGKEELGLKCYNYACENFDLYKSAELLSEAIKRSSLSISDCLKHPVIARQLKAFYRYKWLRRYRHRTYSDYILFVQKINRFVGSDFLTKTKLGTKILFNPVKNIIFDYKKKIINQCRIANRILSRDKLYKNVQNSYSAKIEVLKNHVQKYGKVKVAFLVMFSSVFPCEPIFEQMLDDDLFDPFIIIIPDMQRSLQHKLSTYNQALEELSNKYMGRVLEGYDITSDIYLELYEDYQIVFFNNPYLNMAHSYHHITYFLNKNVLTLYVNYGFAAVKYGREIMKTDFYNLLWKVCLDSQINFLDVQKHQPIKGKNALVTGYVKMDRLAKAPIYARTRKTIIICPHHTVLGWKSLDISNFLSYCDFFVELPMMYPDIDFVFRPHPLLFSNLIENNIWSSQDVEDYITCLEGSPNIRYDNSGDYFELFANSDAMIHDCSSFVGEYLFTEKPCCYMLKSPEEIEDVFLPMGIACLRHYYKAFCKEDIIRFIDQVIIQGNDPLKEDREKFAQTELKFNYPNATRIVLDTIKQAICINEENF